MSTKRYEFDMDVPHDPFAKPVPRSVGQRFYDRTTGKILGKSRATWGRKGIFYVIFDLVLGALFAVFMWVFFQTLDPRIPTCQLDGSLIGNSPGLGFRPMPNKTVLSTLISYRGTDPDDYEQWTKKLDEFLKVYKTPGLTPGRGQNIHNCDYDKPPKKGQVCDVDIKDWHPCIQENHYMYHKSAPCIFIKLNKIYNWVPEYYNSSTDLPHNMPQHLVQHIRNVEAFNSRELNTIWVSCQGENPADKENIGPVDYIPRQGFPGYFYPYENSEGYLSPIVAVHFRRPRPGILISIECRAWAKNIKYDRADRAGMVHFELMID